MNEEEDKEEESEKSVVVPIFNQDLEFVEDILDEEEIKKVNRIFMHCIPEEIKHYYGLMWKQFIEQDIEENKCVE